MSNKLANITLVILLLSLIFTCADIAMTIASKGM